MRTERMFRSALRALSGPRQPDRAGGRWVLSPVSPDYPPESAGAARRPARVAAAERRRRNLTALAAFIVVTFLLGLTRPLRFLLVVNLVADVLLIAYLVAVLLIASRQVVSSPARYVEEYGNDDRPPEVAGGRL